MDHALILSGFALKLISFTPGFSPVIIQRRSIETVSNGFRAFAVETVKTVG